MFTKKLVALSLLAVTAAGFAANAVFAAAETPERGTITISTTANTELQPDIAEISIAVETSDTKSLQKATEENKLISDKVYSALSSMINKENGDYVKTENFNASPIYNYNNNKKTLSKYQVSNNIIVRTKSIKDTGKMIDKAISLGATNINDLRFSVSSYDKQCNDLLSIATKKAYTRANLIAAATGSSLNGIKTINGSCSTNENAPIQYRLMAKNMLSDAASGSSNRESSTIPIQSGVIKIFANINSTFFVK
ncbi:MAG: SIMPL domain-containing protein [Clostridium sp.]|nr:SIMPL domain-containing protein [Clostridium sp.]